MITFPPTKCKIHNGLNHALTELTKILSAWRRRKGNISLARRSASAISIISRREGRTNIYAPAVDPQSVIREAVGDLVERLRLGAEEQQVVVPVGLLVDLVGELALAPRIVARERAATLLDQVTHACDDLRLRLLGEVWVQQQQDLVVDHGFPFLLPSVLGGLTGKHELGMARTWRGRKRA